MLFRNKEVLEWNNLFFQRFNLQVQADWFLFKVGFFRGLPIFYTKGLSSSQGVPCWKASLFDDVFVSKA